MNVKRRVPRSTCRSPAPEAVFGDGQPLRKARAEAMRISRLAHELRTACFRAYLQDTVHSMSYLAPDILNSIGFDVEFALNSIRPVNGWLSDSAAYLSPVRRPIPRHIRTINGGCSAGVELWRREPFNMKDEAIIRQDALGNHLVVGIFGQSLEIDLRSTGFHLVTRAGAAHLTLHEALPDIIASSVRGCALQEVVDHPLFHGRGFVIDDVVQEATSSTITFEAGQLNLQMPWGGDSQPKCAD